MDSNTYQLTFPVFILAVAAVAWFLFQRQVKKSDTDADAKDAETKAKFKEQGERLGQIEARCHAVELEISTKVGREELDKLYARLDEVRRDFREDLRELKSELLEAFRGK